MSPRERITDYGTLRAGDYVRVFRETTARGAYVRVQWGQPLQTRSFPPDRDGLKAARAFGQAKAAELAAGRGGRARLTVRDVWTQYHAEHFAGLRQNTRETYQRGYDLCVGVIGAGKRADAVKIPDLDRVRRVLRAEPHTLAHRTISEAIKTLKRVWTWAEQRELIARSPLTSYRYTVPKDERTESPDEYTLAEWTAMRHTLDPMRKTDWRAWVALTICGAQGTRQHAVLHLQLADFREEAGEVVWQAAHDKNGKTWEQPMRADTLAALVVARHHHARIGYAGPWLLPTERASNTGPVYTIQSLWSKLRRAEDDAGVAHKPGRAGHGARRLLAGDVWELTQDAALALQAIGDKPNAALMARYLKRRDRRIRDAFGRLDDANRNPTATESEPDDAADPSTQGE